LSSTCEVIEQEFTMYLKARQTAMDSKILLAPVDKQ